MGLSLVTFFGTRKKRRLLAGVGQCRHCSTPLPGKEPFRYTVLRSIPVELLDENHQLPHLGPSLSCAEVLPPDLARLRSSRACLITLARECTSILASSPGLAHLQSHFPSRAPPPVQGNGFVILLQHACSSFGAG